MSETRYEYYKLREVEAFMLNVLEKMKKVKPVFDLHLGYRYPDVEKIVELDSVKTFDFLERLVDAEILDRELHDMEMRCPTCNSPNVSVNYVCPKCVSTYIMKTILLEHTPCGYIGTVTTFGEPSTCPKCGKRLKEGAYRNAGSIYKCADCQQQIETPFIDHWCRECGFKFSFENAIYLPKYSYVPAKTTEVEIAQGIIYPCQVASIFEAQGFGREPQTKVVGESGIEHVFDLAFKGHGTTFFIDIIFALEPMNELELIKSYGKVRDVKIVLEDSDIFLIVIPGLDRSAEAIARSYSLNLITGKKPSQALTNLANALAEKVKTLQALTQLEIGT